MKEDKQLRKMIFVGLMAAMVFVGTFIRIKIPTPLGETMLHLGNIMCILSGLILGPSLGFLAAGIGSGIFDLLDPNFAATFYITFLMKGFYGFVVGWIAHSGGAYGKDSRKNRIASIVGACSYTLLYLLKNVVTMHFILGNPMAAVIPVLITKGTVSLTNAVIAVICSLILHQALRKRMSLDLFQS